MLRRGRCQSRCSDRQNKKNKSESMKTDNQNESDRTGKSQTLILGTMTNSSFLCKADGLRNKSTKHYTVQTPNEPFQRNQMTAIQVRTPIKIMKADAIVHKKLPANLLSATQFINGPGSFVFDKTGEALPDTHV